MNNWNQNPYQGNINSNTQQQASRQWDYRDVNAPAMAPGKAANAFLTRIFSVMSLGLAITGLVAWLFATKYLMVGDNASLFYGGALKWVVMFAPMAFILVLSFGIQRLSYPVATAIFITFAIAMGLSISSIFLMYKLSTVFSVFLMTSGTFAAMALIGATTSIDLTKFGSILMFAVIGLVIAMIVNSFMGSSLMQFVISGVGVLIFAGLTAYDTQRFMRMGYQAQLGNEGANKLALMGALSLYMDFINMFLFLLRIFGGNRN